MNIFNDNRIVMTLDAGGTNFVFSAIQKGVEIVKPIETPSNASDLDRSLESIINGFKRVKEQLTEKPAAISFAFPGPADYQAGIIGDLGNLPAFRGGVALGPMLSDYFDIPVYIANDGDLFTYGEGAAGLLTEVNARLKENHVAKEYRNLLGVTLGTGFGGGIMMNNRLCQGDNSAAGEIWLMRDFKNTKLFAEESVSARAVQRVYRERTGSGENFTPKDIYDIAMGSKKGNREAALEAFNELAVATAEALCNAVTLIDGIIVIGGGLAGASKLLLPKIVEHMNGTIETIKGAKIPRLESKVYNLEDPAGYEDFLAQKVLEVKVPFSNRFVDYIPEKRIAIGLSRLGTSRAVSLGAYAVALEKLEG